MATLPEQAWEHALRRAQIIEPLALSESVGHEAADAAAQALGQSSGGKGKGRLPESVERIIRELLKKRFLTKQKRSLAALHREVARACKLQKLRVPARNTVALRIASLAPLKTTRLREGQDASRTLQGAGGVPQPVSAPLEYIDVLTRCVLGKVCGDRMKP